MKAMLRSWRQKIKRHPVAIGVIGFVVVVVIALVFALVWFNGTGFDGYNQVTTAHTISGPSAGTVVRTEVYQPGKSLWDWLQLLGVLAIPVAVGFGTVWFTRQQHQTDIQIALDNQREEILQNYIDKMATLLLEGKLLESQQDVEVRKIARVRTLTTLSRLDKKRKGSVLQFLHESGLIDKDKRIIALRGADLSEADLSGADLHGDHLGGVDLRKANLRKADLRDIIALDDEIMVFSASEGGYAFADFRGADLRNADLRSRQGITLTE